MNTKMFWAMHADGRLESLARNDPLEFEIVCENVTEELVKNSNNLLRQIADEQTLRLLWEAPTFEQRSSFARDNPEASEKKRERIINAQIRLFEDPDKVVRATRLQWRIDCERNKHKTPLGACIAISRMMNESMWGDNGLRDSLNRLAGVCSGTYEKPSPSPSCSIIQFKPTGK